MVFKNNSELYIGMDKQKFVYKLDDTLSKEKFDESVMKEDKKIDNKLSYFLESQGRLFRLLEFLNTNIVPNTLIFGRIFTVGKNHNCKQLKKEFNISNMRDLNDIIGNHWGTVLIEFIVLSEKVSLSRLLEYCRFSKFRCKIYTIVNIEDNDKYLSSNNINKIEIPSYFKKMIKALDK